jgi:hypothetical protein
MGMYKNIQDILQVLWHDEELLRLLHYSPETPNSPDPLDPSLPNIKEIDEMWEIRKDIIKLTPKENDLTDLKTCKLFVYLGNGRANRGNPLYANQSVLINVIVPSEFQNGDFRAYRIGDKLRQLFSQEYVTSPWKMDYAQHRLITRALSPFIGYEYEFDFTEFKK